MTDLNEIMSAPKRSRGNLSHILDNVSESQTNTPRRSSIDSSFKLIQIMEKKFDGQSESIKNLLMESEARLLAEFDKRIESLTNDFKVLGERVQQLETVADDFLAMKSEIVQLKLQIKAQENSLVASELRINNVPFYENENLIDIFRSICNVINTPVPAVSALYRLKNANNKFKANSPDAVIIVKLMSAYDRNFFLKSLSAHRKSKTDFCFRLNDIGFESQTKFYVNENLTQPNYKILQAALKIKRQNKLHAVFTIRGLVYVKVSSTENPRCIFDDSELDQFFLHNSHGC